MARLPIPRRLTIAGAVIISVIVAAMAAVACFGPGSLSVDRNVGIEGRVMAAR